MLQRIRRRFNVSTARLGLYLLKRSNVVSGFFGDWRWALFDRAERAGLHILPVHYYSPLPDVGALVLDDNTPHFMAASPETLDAALSDLNAMAVRYEAAYAAIAQRVPFADTDPVTEFRFGKAPYSTLEAELLYGLIRSAKPRQIVEIGCGHTTFLIAEAIRAERDSGYAPTFECIEPFRPDYLETLPAEVTRFRDTPLQSVPVERFLELQAGDILFIDSSHVVRYGSDVVYELATILPRLRPGVLVHFHDIFLPYDYPSDWLLEGRFFWNEQYMLSALLQDAPRYRIRYPLHQLYRQRRAETERLFPLLGQTGHRPGAYWIEILETDNASHAG